MSTDACIDISERRYLTVKDLQQRFSLSKSKIYELLDTKKIRSVKFGAARRIPIEALEEFESDLNEDGRA